MLYLSFLIIIKKFLLLQKILEDFKSAYIVYFVNYSAVKVKQIMFIVKKNSLVLYESELIAV